MRFANRVRLMNAAVVLASGIVLSSTLPAFGQDYPPPPSFSSGQVDNLVSRIALYPDPLLAQVFAAASFPDQIPDAARWADQYRNLHGSELADAIYQANLQFDPAVQALIPFPSVLDMMASDMNWTSELGNAVLADRSLVMDAVQRMRRSAEQYGYLQSNQQIRVVNDGPAVAIEPVDPSLIYVPTYDPYVVYAPPRPGFYVGSAIGFGSCYSIGAFGGWGWGGGFNWYNHAVLVNNSVWGRTWYNRDAYVHNYGNWDRGNWRNSYASRDRGLYRNNSGNRYNSYSNSGAYSRGSSNMYSNPNRGYGNYDTRGGYNRGIQTPPVAPSQSYDRGNRYQYNNSYSTQGNYARGTQPAPVVPSQSYDRGSRYQYNNSYSNQGNYSRGTQTAPVAPSQSYDRGSRNQFSNTYSNQGSYGRSAQPAPAAPSQSYDRHSYSNSGRAYTASPAPAPQGRSFGAVPGNQGGHFDRAGGRRY